MFANDMLGNLCMLASLTFLGPCNFIELLLTGVKIPRNKGGHYPFRKSQLDSRMFDMEGPTGLWTHYHLINI